MRYEMMLPYQIRQAIDEHWPIVLPLGVLEYHGEHQAVGLDTLVVQRCLELLEEKTPIVILPAFYYGASSYAVEPAKGSGSVHVPADVLSSFAKHLFTSLLEIGFRNIHAVIHHQTENFVAGMPTDLAFKVAGRQVTFDFLEKTRGQGWWGDNKMKDYYQQHEQGTDPFNWIQIHCLMDQNLIEEFGFDHAGFFETSLLMSLYPKAVEMDHLDTKKWYLESAKNANKEHGDRTVKAILTRLENILGK